MRLLLDVHAFVWWDSQKDKLSPLALSECESPTNTLHFSLASVWEMQIKQQIGKLTLRIPLKDLLRDQQEKNDLTIEPITVNDVYGLSALPLHHRDPFDRLLVAQAKSGDFRLVTRDPEIAEYDVDILW